jgi:hypothetical protein
MFSQAYNLVEPEHSAQFPLLSFEVLMPQVFGTQSLISSDLPVSTVFFNEDSPLIEQLQSRGPARQF